MNLKGTNLSLKKCDWEEYRPVPFHAYYIVDNVEATLLNVALSYEVFTKKFKIYG